jgi:hypothetical protein
MFSYLYLFLVFFALHTTVEINISARYVSNKLHTTKVAKISDFFFNFHIEKAKIRDFCGAKFRFPVRYEPLSVHWVYLLLYVVAESLSVILLLPKKVWHIKIDFFLKFCDILF